MSRFGIDLFSFLALQYLAYAGGLLIIFFFNKGRKRALKFFYGEILGARLGARPLTHELFVSFAHAFGVKLKEVFIYRFEDGVFSSELTFSDGERTVVIDSPNRIRLP